MKSNLYYIFGALLCVALFTDCASIIHGSKQTVDFSSQPPGAMVMIDGKEAGKTPTSVELRRKGRLKGEADIKKGYDVKILMDGYYPYEIKVKREMDAWFLGNLLFGGLIGIIVDASNGSMYKLTPDQIIAQIARSNTSLDPKDERIYIAVTLEIDPSWEKIGTLTKK